MPNIQEIHFMTGRKIDLEAETDSTHREILAMLPNDLLTLDDIPAIRAMIAGQPADFPEEVLVEDTYISGLNNDPDVRIRLYNCQLNSKKMSPGLLWMHPGGMTIGSPNMEDLTNAQART